MRDARRILAAVALLLFVTACSSTPRQDAADYPEPVYSYSRIVPEDLPGAGTEFDDPWEGLNKRIYTFNYHFDRWVFIPVTDAWRRHMPSPIRKGVNNFFNNLRDIRTLANSVLQLSPHKTAQAGSRALLNSTVGLLGFIDVATDLEIPRPEEDFGQTLGYWGVPQGPYVVIPMLGPSNLRDVIGLAPDAYLQTEVYRGLLSSALQTTIWVLDSIDTRSQVPFRYYETGSVFEYEAVRWLYSTKRELDVGK